MENKGYRQVIGNPRAPYTNGLARRYGLATRFFGVGHPSLPNYLALIAGSTFGVRHDCTSCHFDHRNLATQLDSAEISWKAYSAGIPNRCYQGARAPGYRKVLDPFLYFESVTRDPEACSRIVPMERLYGDLLGGSLPAFSWITPSLCDDTHQCGVGAGDRYLSRLVPSLFRAIGPHGALFLLWDEGRSSRGCCGGPGGGRLPAIVIGPDVRPHARLGAPLNDYSVLRSLETAFELQPLGHAKAANPHVLASLFLRPLDAA
jgi:phosphatidylinositol-3-phosphatase